MSSLLVLALLAVPDAAIAGEGRWSGVATPPRPTLPTVSVELGEPGEYVPVLYGEGGESGASSRITLTAVNGEYPFNGYIGYDFVVDNVGTRDIPVIARAVLAPRQRWTFTTWVQADGTPFQVSRRELAVYWGDRSTRNIARVSLGVPPWTKQRPLVVVKGSELSESVSAFGAPAYASIASKLSDEAQWYRGFSSLVIPTELWLELPIRVKEAIFGSRIHVTFLGAPRASQELTAIDKALIPVEFERGEGSVTFPWPYGSGTVDTPIRWKAKAGSGASSDADCPFLVESSISRFAADGSILNFPRPHFRRASKQANESLDLQQLIEDLAMERKQREPNVVAILLRETRTLHVFSVLLIACIALWILLRRRASVPAIAIVVAAALSASAVVLLNRDRLHLREATGVHELLLMRPGNVVDTRREYSQYGEANLGEIPMESGRKRLSVSGRGSVIQNAEVRSGQTAPGFGMMIATRGAWDSTRRWTSGREIRSNPGIAVLGRSTERITLQVPIQLKAQSIAAEWFVDGRYQFGEAQVDSNRSEEIVIRAGNRIPEFNDRGWGWAGGHGDGVRLWLVDKSPLRHREIEWRQPLEPGDFSEFWVRGATRRDDEASITSLFALPPALYASKTVSIALRGKGGDVPFILSGEKGSVRAWFRAPKNSNIRAFDATEALRSVVGDGGFFEVTIPAIPETETGNPLHIRLVVKEKRT